MQPTLQAGAYRSVTKAICAVQASRRLRAAFFAYFFLLLKKSKSPKASEATNEALGPNALNEQDLVTNDGGAGRPSPLLYLRASTGAPPLHTLLTFEGAIASCTPLVPFVANPPLTPSILHAASTDRFSRNFDKVSRYSRSRSRSFATTWGGALFKKPGLPNFLSKPISAFSKPVISFCNRWRST